MKTADPQIAQIFTDEDAGNRRQKFNILKDNATEDEKAESFVF
jgi:hypothetical protein